MEIIFVLIPLSLGLVGVAIWGFSWAAKSGQFDDLDSPALSILDEDTIDVVFPSRAKDSKSKK